MVIYELYLLITALTLYGVSSIAAIMSSRNYKLSMSLGGTLSALASIIMIYLSLILLVSGNSYTISIYGMTLSFNPLAAVMILVITIPALASAIFTIEYMDLYAERGRAGVFIMLFNMFVASMIMIVTSWDLLTFLFCWEIMTLTSYLLIVWDYEHGYVRKAGIQYIVSMHILSSIPLVIAVASIYGFTNAIKYDVISALMLQIPGWVRDLIASLMYIAFITKAGLYPMHYWLPDAHPAAPSNISALLSGVMIKMGVYGLIVVMYNLLHPSLLFYYLAIIQGVLSIFWGSLQAIGEDHGKRLLAYSSISQIGYITVPLSLSIITRSINVELSIILFAAGILYMFTHSLFKSLLFLTSGCYLYSAGTADLNKVVGVGLQSKTLIFSLLVGGLSLAGLPPLLGFLAKISVYATVLSGNQFLYGLLAFILIALSPLTLLYAIKYVAPALRIGINTDFKKRIGQAMKIGLLIPALALIGLGCYSIYGLLVNISIAYYHVYAITSFDSGILHVIKPYTYYFPILIAVAVSLGIIAAYIDRGRDAEIGRIWTTGYLIPPSRYAIRPRHIYNEIYNVFSSIINGSHEIYVCLVWNIPGKIMHSGIMHRITGFFSDLAVWLSRKMIGFARKYSSLHEFKLDEMTGSSLVSIVRIYSSIVRVIAISPIALFLIAILILSLIIITILMVIG